MRSKAMVGVSLGLTLGVGTNAVAQTLTGVATEKTTTGTELILMGEKLSRPKMFPALTGNGVVFQFDGSLTEKPVRVNLDDLILKSYSTHWFSEKPMRFSVKLNFSKPMQPEIREVVGGWKVSFKAPGAAVPVLPRVTNPSVVKQPIIDPKLFSPTTPKKVITTEKPAVILPKPLATPPADPLERNVNLDFTNTDVVQILKALAIQAGVSIVTGSDIKQNISVSLDKVTVGQALDMVTAVANLRYRKVGNAYLVTSSESFNNTMSRLETREPKIESRVIPIFSGDAKELRASAIALLNQQKTFGEFQIFLPRENFSIEKTPNGQNGAPTTDVKIQQAQGAAGAAAGGAVGGAASGSSTGEGIKYSGLREQYLVLIGPVAHIDEVAERIEAMDKAIAKSTGFESGTDTSLVSRTYTVKSDRVSAADLVQTLMNEGENKLNVDLVATPKNFVKQAIVMVGREANVKRAESLLDQLDSSGYGNQIVNYDVKFSDPRALREALISNIPGLRASLAPGSAGQPDVFSEGTIKSQGNDVSNNTNNTGDKGGQQGAAQQQVGATQQTKQSDAELEQPFASHEKSAVPMRLILRGTQKQITEATMMLATLDIAPKQVAIELRVMELTKEEAYKAGIDWNILGGGAVKFVRLNNSQTTPANSIGGSINGKNVSGDVAASLDAIANKTNLITRPNIFGQDGRQAEIFVGDVVRYVQSITNSQNGPTIVTGEVPVGVRLSVLPRIGADGNLTMELRPRVSILRGFTDVPGGGQLPQTSSRFSQSTFTMASGETIAIGGLIQDQDTLAESGIPFLKDIPILGQLFKKTTKNRNRTEIVFFITAKTIDGVVSREQKMFNEEAGKFLPKKQGGKN